MPETLTVIQISAAELSDLIRQAVKAELDSRQTKDSEKFISANEARKLWSPELSRTTLHRYVAKGLLTPYRIGGRTSYKLSEVQQAVKEIKRFDRVMK